LLGASDNGVSVAVALEVLEVLSRGREPTKHPVIFLFNGAEEKGMLVEYLIFIL
jgi:Zn-dependent M28 family amino/carboxypeptidase